MFTTAHGAQTVAELYRARVEIADQTAEERTRAFQNAGRAVVTRASGIATDNLALPARLADWVTSYAYDPDAARLYLVVEFDASAVKRFLAQHKIPAWGDTRPVTLVWIAVREPDGTLSLAGSDGPSAYQLPLQEESQRRGIPLAWPIFDLSEELSAPITNEEELIQRLRVAAATYPVEALLIGIIKPVADSGRVQWRLIRGAAEDSWNSVGADTTVALGAGLNQLVIRLKAGTPTPGGGPLVQQQLISMVVADVFKLADYARLFAFLEGLVAVAQAWPTRLTPEGRLSIALEPRVTHADLTSALNHSGILILDEDSRNLAVLGDATLCFRLSSVAAK